MVGAQLDSNDTHLLGICAGPDGELGDGAVNHNPIQFDVKNCPTESLVRCNAGARSQIRTYTRINRLSPSLNPRVRSTQVREANPSGVIVPVP